MDVPGAVFDGVVLRRRESTLELASAASIGALTGLGTDFTGFDTITVDPNAQWNVSGSNTVASGTGITIGSSADLEITGSLSGAADFLLQGGTLGIANAVDAGAIFDFTDQAGFLPDDLTLSAVSGISFDNAITGFSGSDEIVLPNVTFAAGSTPIIGAGAVTVDLQAGGTFTFSSFAFKNGAHETLTVGAHSITDAACFAAGTMIRTEQGEVAVESTATRRPRGHAERRHAGGALDRQSADRFHPPPRPIACATHPHPSATRLQQVCRAATCWFRPTTRCSSMAAWLWRDCY